MAALRLVLIVPELGAAFNRSVREFEAIIGAAAEPLSDVIGPVLEQSIELLASKPRNSNWGCFLTVDDTICQIVGTCAYKDGPNANGAVEIAYYTFPAFEKKGYATAMANELTARSGRNVVLAHTLPQPSASCRVLEKAGFTRIGEVVDAEDGLVWRWEKRPV